MATTESKRMEFILWLTGFFHGHYEDPNWGRNASSQIMFNQALYELAKQVQDPEDRKAIQKIAEKGIAAGKAKK